MGQYRLSGTGLPGDRIESRPQPQLCPLYYQQVLYPQLSQH